MNDKLKRFEELIRNDSAFQEKLKAAAEAYTGEKNEEAVFQNVLVPLAEEYGISATFAEFQDYMKNISLKNRDPKDRELSSDEVDQIAGGTKGVGATACFVIGAGLGGTEDDDGMQGYCVILGVGDNAGACMGNGTGT